MRIGIDVGGTNTDAVLMDGDSVVADAKVTTTPDVTDGIMQAVQGLRERRDFDPAAVTGVMLGTTHFINAIVEGRDLSPTAAVRLGLPATQSLPPLTAWPSNLVSAIGDHTYLCHGGHEYDGRVISQLDPGELHRIADELAAADVRSVAITSVFSLVNAEFELRAAEILAERLPGLRVSLSHEVGRTGLLERENATVINAALGELAERICGGMVAMLRSIGLEAPLYLSQNDGTLMGVDYARQYPVMTFASGPTNSMRGAAYLSGVDECAVVDVGGTTTDVGMLHRGFPREASTEVSVGGIRTNFRMPDVLSFGVGGGSLVRQDSGGVTVGPESVGYRLRDEALVFGGETLTATDLVVAAGRADIGEPERVASLDRDLVDAGLAYATERITGTIDRMRTSRSPVPVVLVGGGSVLLPESIPLASSVMRPQQFAVANAVGAAIAQISGDVDRIFAVQPGQRDAALDTAKQEATDRALIAGATPGTVEIVEVEEIPLAYLPGNATRIRVKAVGDLARDPSVPASAVHGHGAG
jgi:N-methylhydantoinase A/oxoprolinase/acetone carboxylase beta subunit